MGFVVLKKTKQFCQSQVAMRVAEVILSKEIVLKTSLENRNASVLQDRGTA